jgi:hypothetical protein
MLIMYASISDDFAQIAAKVKGLQTKLRVILEKRL